MFFEIQEDKMINGVQAALSGLHALTTRVEKNANNVANMQTQGFKKDRVLLSERYPQGVEATVGKMTFPGPYGVEMTERGYELVEQSNVDLVEEIPDLLLNKNGFSANLKTIETVNQMTQSLLDIKA
jgi:flagellar hook protein FlgE